MAADGCGVSLWDDKHVLELDTNDGCATLTILKNHRIICFKRVNLWYVNYILIIIKRKSQPVLF